MWLIKRVYMDGTGSEEAFYKDLTLDYIGLHMPDQATDTAHGLPVRKTTSVVSTYQQLGNGGGKSTYIALLLSIFEPGTNDFTQYLANRRQPEFHYHNYFYQELSVILVEMINGSGQTLLLGHAHQRRGGDVERIMFICDAPDLLGTPFDEVPSYSRAERIPRLRPHANSLRNFEDWLNARANSEDGIHWRKTNTIKEWHAALLEQQINIDLIKMMTVFNSEEGGLTRFIDYKTEHDFLGAFFICTMSSDTTTRLRELVAHEVKRQGELEGIRRNESFLKDVLSNWQAFLGPARELENAQRQQRQMDDSFREAMRDLTAFIGEAQAEQEKLGEQSQRLQESIDQTTARRDMQGKRKTLLEHALAQLRFNEQKARVDALQQEADTCHRQLQITHAAIDYKAYAKALSAYRQVTEELKIFQSETEKPLQIIFERTAGEALGVLERAISNHRQQETDIKATLAQLDKESEAFRQSCGQLQKKLGNLESESSQCRQDKRKGKLRLDALREEGVILPGESPATAQQRLESILRHSEQGEAQARVAANQTEQALETHQLAVRKASLEQSQAQHDCNNAEQRHLAAVESAQALAEHYHLLPLSARNALDLEDTNWHSTLCISQLNTVLSADTHTLNGLKQRLLEARHTLNELKRTGHELVTKQIHQALEELYAAGIARDKVWAFPHYLASAFNDDAQRIATVVDQNPGRYLSLVTLDDATFAQISEISATLPWKGAPIVIYQLDEARDLQGLTSDSAQVVLSNPDKHGYSKAAYAARLQELENSVAAQEASVKSAERLLETLTSFRDECHQHHQQHGKHWSNLIEQRDQTRSRLAYADAALEQAHQHEQQLRDEKAQARTRFENAQQQRHQAEKVHDRLTRFVDTEWAAHEAAVVRLAQLAGQIQRNREEFERQSDELAQKTRITEIKHTESTCIGIQIREWEQLRNHALYSEITAIESSSVRNPQDAHGAALKAHAQLLEAAQSDLVTQLKQQRNDAEQTQHETLARLSAHSVYPAYSHDIKTAAISDLSLINDRIAQLETQKQRLTDLQIKEQARLAHMSDHCGKTRAALDEEFVWEDQPTDIEAIQNNLSSISDDLHAIRQQLAALQEQRTLQSDRSDAVKERLQTARMAQVGIQPITPSSAAGLPIKILNIDEYAETLTTQCQTYAHLQATLKQHDTRVATVWGRFRQRIEEESAKAPEVSANRLHLRQLNAIATYHEVLGDLEKIDIGITEVFKAVQGTLEQFKLSIDLTVTHLTTHLEKALKLLRRTKSVRIPDDCPVLPGRPIVKMTERLNEITVDLKGVASTCLQHWIAKGQIPYAPNRDTLTADLVQSVFGEGALDVRLLKTNANRPKWTHITRLEGSGGQKLTAAFLLYVTVGKIREYDTGIPGAGFLLADNPLGTSNANDLIRLQTQMAKAYNIQLIYLTGISDANAESMFDNHLFLNKAKNSGLRDQILLDNERHTLWAASLVANPASELNVQVDKA
ncbi:hypothetical protein [Carnimonas nigrificans]|uniref:hypothetical protein n=1 Tax=Carnimonas nigrificans TaxID=64323 RepID=UPI0004700DA5|nr:hypothetical protein [Carnimonas nigrificans]